MKIIRSDGSKGQEVVMNVLAEALKVNRAQVTRMWLDDHNTLHWELNDSTTHQFEPKHNQIVRGALCALGAYELCSVADHARVMAQHNRTPLHIV